METFDDKSKGKTSIHRPKIMFTKYLILVISLTSKVSHSLGCSMINRAIYIYGGVRTYVHF